MLESSTIFSLLPAAPSAEEHVPDSLTASLEPAAIYRSGLKTECRVQTISRTGAIIRGCLDAEIGDDLAVELATGQRPRATVAWVKAHALGVVFKQPIDVRALINRNLLCQPVERRKMPRVELCCSAWLKHCEELSPVTVRNISSRGLKLEAECLPPVGSDVSVYLEGLNLPPGEIVWEHEPCAGVELHHDVSWSLIVQWLRRLAKAERHETLSS